MLVRIINPSFSPSLLLGRIFIKNQKPEYVGVAQKRFAWGIGLALAIPMFYSLTLNWNPSLLNAWVCLFCLALMYAESAFSFCLGCWIYNNILHIKTTNCPGGACELQFKDDSQKFNKIQKTIVSLFIIALISGTSLYMFKTDNRTYFGEKLGKIFKTKKTIALEAEAEFEKAWEEVNEDDEWNEE